MKRWQASQENLDIIVDERFIVYVIESSPNLFPMESKLPELTICMGIIKAENKQKT